jgi:hypothetical protein
MSSSQNFANKVDWRRNAKLWHESGLVEINEENGSKRITGGRDIIDATVNRVLVELGLKRIHTESETSA